MYLKIKQADLLQSVGFALTAATEDYEHLKGQVHMVLASTIHNAEVLTAEAQKELGARLVDASQKVARLQIIERMAKFAGDTEELFLDAESFALLELNLPAR